jgi:hypothetical protein
MSGEAPASYADVLRDALHLPPADRRMLVEDVARSLDPTHGEIPEEERRRRAVDLAERLSRLPVHNPNDGLSSIDHDQILYGEGP